MVKNQKNNILNFTREDQGYFLAGLISGDGCFSADRLRILFHLKDMKVAEDLKSALGFGRIYRLKNQQCVEFRVATKVGLRYVLNLINGKFVGSEKTDQLIRHDYSKILGVDILPPLSKVSFENAWLAGFFEADGCAQIHVNNAPTLKFKKQMSLSLGFTQKKRFLLDCISELFIGQKVSANTHKVTEKRKVATTGYAFQIRSLKLLPVLFAYFDAFHL